MTAELPYPVKDGIVSIGIEEFQALKLSADRWNSLMKSQRMTFMGTSHFDHTSDPQSPTPVPNNYDYWHFTLNIWSTHNAYGQEQFAAENERTRNLLVNYADRMVIATRCGTVEPG
jgi:hypothetical protein